MRSARRILGVASVRFLEGARGPLAGFLILFLLVAAAVSILTPGDPGQARQQAVDRLVLDAGLLISAFAAAALGATSLASDRSGERDAVLGATPLRPPELLAGGLIGHGMGLVLLLGGFYVLTFLTTGILAGGNDERAPTRQALFADGTGGVVLAKTGDSTTYRVRVPQKSFDLGQDSIGASIRIREFLLSGAQDFPRSYDVGVAVGNDPEQAVRVIRGLPLKLTIRRDQVGTDGAVEIHVRRTSDAYALGLYKSSLIAEGPRRSLLMNLAKALTAWFGALLVLAAAAAAFSTLVQAPVAAAGALLLALVGHSLGLLGETAELLRIEGMEKPAVAGILDTIVFVWPDLAAADMTEPVVSRWDIAARSVAGRLPAGLGSAAGFLAFGWLVLWARRQR